MNRKVDFMKAMDFLSKTNIKVLEFLCQRPYDSFYSAQITKKTNLSRGGVNQALRLLARENLLTAEKIGQMTFYRVDLSSPVIRQFKVLQNILSLDSFINKIRPHAAKVVLFGSCAEGKDTEDSDIDILAISSQKARIDRLASKIATNRKIQLIVKSPQEYISLENKEPVFFGEVEKGRLLWEEE